MAFNWLKKFKEEKAEVVRLRASNEEYKKAIQWNNSRLEEAQRQRAHAEHEARQAVAYKEEVVFLRQLVKDITSTVRVEMRA